MAQFTIEINDPDQAELLEELAAQNNLTSVEYAQNIVFGWLESQIKGAYVAHTQKLSLPELKKIAGPPKEIRQKIALLNQAITKGE